MYFFIFHHSFCLFFFPFPFPEFPLLWQAEGGASPADAASHLHFWVLVLPPNRDVTTPTVVEPTNGQVIPLSPAQNPPYRQVHAVFDHTNYWASVRYDSPVSSDMVSSRGTFTYR